MAITPTQNDALATWLGWIIHVDTITAGDVGIYIAPDCSWRNADDWQPDQSRDDCWPIIQRIEELGLWTLFRSTIAVRDWLLNHNGTWAEIYMMMPPSVIVAAVLEIIEKKGGAN